MLTLECTLQVVKTPEPNLLHKIWAKVPTNYRDSWVNGAMDNGSNCLLVQNVAGTERIGLSHSKVAWLMVQEILDNGSILFLFSTSKLYIFSH